MIARLARIAFGAAALAILATVWITSGGHDPRLTPDECAVLLDAATEARDDAAVLDMQRRGCDLSPGRLSTETHGGTVP